MKYFKKEDEPNAKDLTDADIYEYKVKLEKENYNNIYLDSEQIKHKESLMEGDAMKKVTLPLLRPNSTKRLSMTSSFPASKKSLITHRHF